MGAIFAKEEKELDLSPGVLNQTSVEDKVWLSVTEENLFNNESFTNEKYYMLQNVIVHERPAGAPHPGSFVRRPHFSDSELSSATVSSWTDSSTTSSHMDHRSSHFGANIPVGEAEMANQGYDRDYGLADRENGMAREQYRTGELAVSLLAANMVNDEQQLSAMALTRLLSSLPGLTDSTNAYFDSTLQKRLYILKRIHLALHRERARDRLVEMSDSFSATDALRSAPLSASGSNFHPSSMHPSSDASYQQSFPIVVRMTVRLLLSVISQLQTSDGVSSAILSTLWELLSELPPLALRDEPADVVDAFKAWLTQTIDKAKEKSQLQQMQQSQSESTTPSTSHGHRSTTSSHQNPQTTSSVAAAPFENFGLVLECLFGLCVARGSLCDLLAMMSLCINVDFAPSSSLKLQNLNVQRFPQTPVLTVTPFLNKIRTWNIDLFLSPLSRHSLLSTWMTRVGPTMDSGANSIPTSLRRSHQSGGLSSSGHSTSGHASSGHSSSSGAQSSQGSGGPFFDSLATDGTYLYIHGAHGLVKVGTGANGSSQGRVYALQSDFYHHERAWLCYVSGSLFFRSPSISPALLLVINPATLEVVDEVFGNPRVSPFLPEQSAKEMRSFDGPREMNGGSSSIWRSPMFTEGRYLHVLSVVGYFDFRFPKFAVDRYDPLKQMAHISRVVLHYKESDTTSLTASVLNPNLLARCAFYSNGQYLVVVMPPSINHGLLHDSFAESPAYVCRTFRLSDGEMISNVPTDLADSFIPSSSSSSSHMSHHQKFAAGNPIAAAYDPVQNVIWCSQMPLVGRFSNAGIAPKFEFPSTPQEEGNWGANTSHTSTHGPSHSLHSQSNASMPHLHHVSLSSSPSMNTPSLPSIPSLQRPFAQQRYQQGSFYGLNNNHSSLHDGSSFTSSNASFYGPSSSFNSQYPMPQQQGPNHLSGEGMPLSPHQPSPMLPLDFVRTVLATLAKLADDSMPSGPAEWNALGSRPPRFGSSKSNTASLSASLTHLPHGATSASSSRELPSIRKSLLLEPYCVEVSEETFSLLYIITKQSQDRLHLLLVDSFTKILDMYRSDQGNREEGLSDDHTSHSSSHTSDKADLPFATLPELHDFVRTHLEIVDSALAVLAVNVQRLVAHKLNPADVGLGTNGDSSLGNTALPMGSNTVPTACLLTNLRNLLRYFVLVEDVYGFPGDSLISLLDSILPQQSIASFDGILASIQAKACKVLTVGLEIFYPSFSLQSMLLLTLLHGSDSSMERGHRRLLDSLITVLAVQKNPSFLVLPPSVEELTATDPASTYASRASSTWSKSSSSLDSSGVSKGDIPFAHHEPLSHAFNPSHRNDSIYRTGSIIVNDVPVHSPSATSSQLFTSLLAQLLKEAQLSLSRSSSSSMLDLVQAIQKDLLLRTEEAEVRGNSAATTRALIDFVRLVFGHALDSFSSVLSQSTSEFSSRTSFEFARAGQPSPIKLSDLSTSPSPTELRSSSSDIPPANTSSTANWWSMELMQDLTTSVVGSLLPTLLHSLFLFSSNHMIASALLPSIVKLLTVVDNIHASLPDQIHLGASEANPREPIPSGSWGWTEQEQASAAHPLASASQNAFSVSPTPMLSKSGGMESSSFVPPFVRTGSSGLVGERSQSEQMVTRVVESGHPYETGKVTKQVVTIPDAVFLSLIFDERCSTLESTDTLELYEDEACTRKLSSAPSSTFSGNRSRWPRRRVIVPGNKVVFLFRASPPQVQQPPKISSASFATSFETAATTPPSTRAARSKRSNNGNGGNGGNGASSSSSTSAWGYRCVVVGNMISTVQSALPWSVHLEKTLCCLGGQFAASLIRGNPLSDVEMEASVEPSWLNHPLFDGGLTAASAASMDDDQDPEAMASSFVSGGFNSTGSFAPSSYASSAFYDSASSLHSASSASSTSEADIHRFLWAMVSGADDSFATPFVRWISSTFLPPVPAALESKLTLVKRAERAVLAAVLQHSGLGLAALFASQQLLTSSSSSSQSAYGAQQGGDDQQKPLKPSLLDPSGALFQAFKMCASHMKKVRDTIMRRRQEAMSSQAEAGSDGIGSRNPSIASASSGGSTSSFSFGFAPSQTAQPPHSVYRPFAEPVVERSLFLLRDVSPSLRSPTAVPQDLDDAAIRAMVIQRLGPRLEVLSNIGNAVCNFVLLSAPSLHTAIQKALDIRRRRAAHRCDGFESMRHLLASVRGSDMKKEVLHFLGSSIRLSAYKPGIIDERKSPIWPHSYLDHLRGCGPALASRVRTEFESLFDLLASLLVNPSSSPSLQLLAIEPWALKFTPSDLPFLHEVKLFHILHNVMSSARTSIDMLKDQLNKQTISKRGTSVMHQSKSPDQVLKLNAELALQQHLYASASSMFKLIALTCISPLYVEISTSSAPTGGPSSSNAASATPPTGRPTAQGSNAGSSTSSSSAFSSASAAPPQIDQSPTPFHDSFFSLIHLQLSAALERLKEETKQELQGTLKTTAAGIKSRPKNTELLDLLVFLYTLSAANLVKSYLVQQRFVHVFLLMLTIRSDRQLKSLVFRLLRRILVHPSADPHMLLDLDSPIVPVTAASAPGSAPNATASTNASSAGGAPTQASTLGGRKKTLLKLLMELQGTVQLWSSSNLLAPTSVPAVPTFPQDVPVNTFSASATTSNTPQSAASVPSNAEKQSSSTPSATLSHAIEPTFSFAKQVITSTLLHHRPFERPIRKRALTRSASGKLALSLPFCAFFSPSLTLPFAWDPVRSPRSTLLEFSRDARIAFVSGFNFGSSSLNNPSNQASHQGSSTDAASNGVRMSDNASQVPSQGMNRDTSSSSSSGPSGSLSAASSSISSTSTTSEYDLQTLSRRAIVVRADHSIPDAIPFFYFEVRFDMPEGVETNDSPSHGDADDSGLPGTSSSSMANAIPRNGSPTARQAQHHHQASPNASQGYSGPDRSAANGSDGASTLPRSLSTGASPHHQGIHSSSSSSNVSSSNAGGPVQMMPLPEASFAVGLAPTDSPLRGLPGWYDGSFGYHSADGNKYRSGKGEGRGERYGRKFSESDVIGCGWNRISGTIFFTKNGVNMGVAFKNVTCSPGSGMVPVVGFLTKSPRSVSVNFGQMPFLFDTSAMVRRATQQVRQTHLKIGAEASALSLETTALLRSLVLVKSSPWRSAILSQLKESISLLPSLIQTASQNTQPSTLPSSTSSRLMPFDEDSASGGDAVTSGTGIASEPGSSEKSPRAAPSPRKSSSASAKEKEKEKEKDKDHSKESTHKKDEKDALTSATLPPSNSSSSIQLPPSTSPAPHLTASINAAAANLHEEDSASSEDEVDHQLYDASTLAYVIASLGILGGDIEEFRSGGSVLIKEGLQFETGFTLEYRVQRPQEASVVVDSQRRTVSKRESGSNAGLSGTFSPVFLSIKNTNCSTADMTPLPEIVFPMDLLGDILPTLVPVVSKVFLDDLSHAAPSTLLRHSLVYQRLKSASLKILYTSITSGLSLCSLDEAIMNRLLDQNAHVVKEQRHLHYNFHSQAYPSGIATEKGASAGTANTGSSSSSSSPSPAAGHLNIAAALLHSAAVPYQQSQSFNNSMPLASVPQRLDKIERLASLLGQRLFEVNAQVELSRLYQDLAEEDDGRSAPRRSLDVSFGGSSLSSADPSDYNSVMPTHSEGEDASSVSHPVTESVSAATATANSSSSSSSKRRSGRRGSTNAGKSGSPVSGKEDKASTTSSPSGNPSTSSGKDGSSSASSKESASASIATGLSAATASSQHGASGAEKGASSGMPLSSSPSSAASPLASSALASGLANLNDAPLELASFGKPLRFCDIKLGTLLKLCTVDKPRRPGDWNESMGRLVGEVGIAVDLDAKLSQVLMRFVHKRTGIFEDVWVPHRLLVLSSSGLANDEFLLTASPQNVFESSDASMSLASPSSESSGNAFALYTSYSGSQSLQSAQSTSVTAPSSLSSFTSTLLAPFSFWSSSSTHSSTSSSKDKSEASSASTSTGKKEPANSASSADSKEGSSKSSSTSSANAGSDKQGSPANADSTSSANTHARDSGSNSGAPSNATLVYHFVAPIYVVSSREVWQKTPKKSIDNFQGSLSAALMQSPLSAKDEGTVSLALYWEHQRSNTLLQLLFATIFLNDSHFVPSVRSVGGPLQLVHSLRLVSSTIGDRETMNRLLGSQSPYAAFLGGHLSSSTIGTRALLSSPSRPMEHRIFESKLVQLMRADYILDTAEERNTNADSDLDTSSLPSSSATATASHSSKGDATSDTLISIGEKGDSNANSSSSIASGSTTAAAKDASSSTGSLVPPLELPSLSKSSSHESGSLSPNQRVASSALDLSSSILSLPPANLPFALPEELSLKGYLTKVGKVFRRKKYWFVLSGPTLSYYKNPQANQPMVGQIDLRLLTGLQGTEKKKKEFEFDLLTTDRTLSLQATSNEEKERWIHAISQHAQYFKLTSMPLTGDSLLTAFMNECLLHLKESVQTPLVIDSSALIARANAAAGYGSNLNLSTLNSASSASSKSSSHPKGEKGGAGADSAAVVTYSHPLAPSSSAPTAFFAAAPPSKLDISSSLMHSGMASPPSTASSSKGETDKNSSPSIVVSTASTGSSPVLSSHHHHHSSHAGSSPSGLPSSSASTPISLPHLNSLVVPAGVVGTVHPSVQSGAVVVLEQCLYPYTKRKFRKLIQLEWAEHLLVVFDLACFTKSGANVLRFYRDAACMDLIASFSGSGPSAFPPTIIPRTDRFWMVFTNTSNGTDGESIMSPNTGLMTPKLEFGVRFAVSAYAPRPSANLLIGKPSFEFGAAIVDWMLSLVDPHWMRQGVKDVFSYLTAHLEAGFPVNSLSLATTSSSSSGTSSSTAGSSSNSAASNSSQSGAPSSAASALSSLQSNAFGLSFGPAGVQLYDRSLRVLTQLTKLLQRWRSFSNALPPIARLHDSVVVKMFELHHLHKRLGHQDYSLQFQKIFELVVQVAKFSDAALFAPPSSSTSTSSTSSSSSTQKEKEKEREKDRASEKEKERLEKEAEKRERLEKEREKERSSEAGVETSSSRKGKGDSSKSSAVASDSDLPSGKDEKKSSSSKEDRDSKRDSGAHNSRSEESSHVSSSGPNFTGGDYFYDPMSYELNFYVPVSAIMPAPAPEMPVGAATLKDSVTQTSTPSTSSPSLNVPSSTASATKDSTSQGDSALSSTSVPSLSLDGALSDSRPVHGSPRSVSFSPNVSIRTTEEIPVEDDSKRASKSDSPNLIVASETSTLDASTNTSPAETVSSVAPTIIETVPSTRHKIHRNASDTAEVNNSAIVSSSNDASEGSPSLTPAHPASDKTVTASPASSSTTTSSTAASTLANTYSSSDIEEPSVPLNSSSSSITKDSSTTSTKRVKKHRRLESSESDKKGGSSSAVSKDSIAANSKPEREHKSDKDHKDKSSDSHKSGESTSHGKPSGDHKSSSDAKDSLSTSESKSSKSEKESHKDKERESHKDKERESSSASSHKAEKERERLEKAEKERERLEKEKEREREKKKRKQAAKEERIQLEAKASSKASKSLKSSSSSSTATSGPSVSFNVGGSASSATGAPGGSSQTLNGLTDPSMPPSAPSPLWSQHRDSISQGRSQWVAQLAVTGSASATSGTQTSSASSSPFSSKAWFDQALYSVRVLERLQARRESASGSASTFDSPHFVAVPATSLSVPSSFSSSFATSGGMPSNSAGYNQLHDFTVDFAQEALLQARQQPVMMESPHPYPHGVRVTSRVHCPKATQLLVYFDPRSCTEANCDYLMFSKEMIGGDDLGFFTGVAFPPSHEPVVIPGDSFVWSFLSDANGLVATKFYWGFRFTVTPVFTEDVRTELAWRCEEEFRHGAHLDLKLATSLSPSSFDQQLMRFINSTVESLKISSFELNAEQSLASLQNADSKLNYPLLLLVPLQAVIRRFIYLKHLNTCISKLIPLVDLSLHNEAWSIAWLIHQSKHLLFYDVKLDLLNTALISSQSALSKPVIVLNRQQAALAEEASNDASSAAEFASGSGTSNTGSSSQSNGTLAGNGNSQMSSEGTGGTSNGSESFSAFSSSNLGRRRSSRSMLSDPSQSSGNTSTTRLSTMPEGNLASSSSIASQSSSLRSAGISSPSISFAPPSSSSQQQQQGELLFAQGFRNLRYVDPARMRHSDKAWEVKFEGEGADDAGGPYRESLTLFCIDVQRPSLGLFIPTENQKGKIGLNQDRFVPDPTATSARHLAQFEFLGKLMGVAIRTKQPLELSFPSLVWKSLVGAKLDRSDLEGIDKQLVMFLDAIENAGSDDSDMLNHPLNDSILSNGINFHHLNALKISGSRLGAEKQTETLYRDEYGFLVSEESIIQTHLNLQHTAHMNAQYGVFIPSPWPAGSVWNFTSEMPTSSGMSQPHMLRTNSTMRLFQAGRGSGSVRSRRRSEMRRPSMTNVMPGAKGTSPLLNQTITKEQFDQVFFETFRVARSRGNVEANAPASYVDLIPGGSNVPVTWSNRMLFASKVEQFRLGEFATQMTAIATGLASIIPTPALSLFSWSELELRVCGRPGLDIVLLQKNTVYHDGLTANSKIVRAFWQALASFTPEEQSLFLRFVWGRSRLPSAFEFGSQRFHLQLLQPSSGSSGGPASSDPFFSLNGESSLSGDAPDLEANPTAATTPSDQFPPPLSRRHSTSAGDSAARLMRLYYSLNGRVADDDLQTLLATLDTSEGLLPDTSTGASTTTSATNSSNAGSTSTAAGSTAQKPSNNPQSSASSSQPSSAATASANAHLPQSRTCFFQLSIPSYSSYAVLRAKLLYAITSCREIDTDFVPPQATAAQMGGVTSSVLSPASAAQSGVTESSFAYPSASSSGNFNSTVLSDDEDDADPAAPSCETQ